MTEYNELTVSDLIKELAKFNQAAIVVLPGIVGSYPIRSINYTRYPGTNEVNKNQVVLDFT